MGTSQEKKGDFMEKNILRTGRHCVFTMHVHLVFVTKYRFKVFSKEILDRMEELFKDICNGFEAELVEFKSEEDHVHLLVNYPPKMAVSKLVNSLKGVSSRRLRQEFPSFSKRYWKGVLWSPSYFASSCGGVPISIIKQYIEAQQKSELTDDSCKDITLKAEDFLVKIKIFINEMNNEDIDIIRKSFQNLFG